MPPGGVWRSIVRHLHGSHARKPRLPCHDVLFVLLSYFAGVFAGHSRVALRIGFLQKCGLALLAISKPYRRRNNLAMCLAPRLFGDLLALLFPVHCRICSLLLPVFGLPQEVCRYILFVVACLHGSVSHVQWLVLALAVPICNVLMLQNSLFALF